MMPCHLIIMTCIIDADYIVRDSKPVVRLFGIDKNGRRVVNEDDYTPYFYCAFKNGVQKKTEKLEHVLRTEKVKKKLGLEEKNFLKIYVDLPANVQKVRDAIKNITDCYEYSINFYRRYLTDKKIYPFSSECRFSTLAFDIETVDRKIVMISVAGKSRKVFTYRKAHEVVACKDEKDMIEKFSNHVKDENPDFIVTYNGDGYDIPFILGRCKELKTKLPFQISAVKRSYMTGMKIEGYVHIDLLNFVNIVLSSGLQSEVFTLDAVANELIGERKEEMTPEEIIECWDADVERLAKYCQQDSVLTKKLAEFMMPQIIEMSRISGQVPFDSTRLTFGLLVEAFLLRKAAEMNIISPNQPHWNQIQERRERRYEGGYVHEPKKGLHENISVFDFRSLYPSIIATYNISPETLASSGYEVPELGYRFLKKPKGFVPTVIEQIIRRRIEIKKVQQLEREQEALKILANSMYGIFGSPGNRWYSYECAASAAAFGRATIKKAIAMAEKAGFEVVYGDTDSMFVKGMTKAGAEKFLDEFNSKMPGIIELELQGAYRRGIFVPQRLGNYTAKKRYALLGMKNELVIRGMEAVRRDWCELAKELQRSVIELVLKKKDEEAVELVRETVKKVRKRDVDIKRLAIRTQLGKPLSEYKVKTPQVTVAKKLIKRGHQIGEGDVLSYVIATGKGSISDRAEPINYAEKKDYDTEYYVNNQIIAVAMRVLSALGYKESEFSS